MSLPASLLGQVETHTCFPGAWSPGSALMVCLDPGKPLMKGWSVSCSECYQKLIVLDSLLPASTTQYQLATQLTRHMQTQRGFRIAHGGYHAAGPGFWVSFVYFDCGLFLIDANRSRKLGTDLEVLVLAFQHGVEKVFDPRLLDPAHYRTQTVHVRFAPPPGPIRCLQDLLAWSGCRTSAARDFHTVTLAEFLPVTSTASLPPPPASPPARPAAAIRTNAAKPTPAAAVVFKEGDVCPRCQAEFKRRPLLHGTFLGCLC